MIIPLKRDDKGILWTGNLSTRLYDCMDNAMTNSGDAYAIEPQANRIGLFNDNCIDFLEMHGIEIILPLPE